MSNEGNGHNPTQALVEQSEKWQVVLTYDTATHHLECGGKVPTLDVYLFLIEMAHRKVETQQKIQDMNASLAGPRTALPGELAALLKGRG